MSKIWAKLVECGSDIHKRKSAVQLLYAEILILATGHKSQGVRYRTIWTIITIENQEDLGRIPEGYIGVSSSVCLTVWACWHQAHRHVDTFCAEKAADWLHGALQSLACKFVWWILHLSQNHFSMWFFGYPRISLLFVYYNMIHVSLFMLPLFHCLSIRLILFSPISSNKNLQVRRFKFHLPDYYVALVRALLTLEGIALAADWGVTWRKFCRPCRTLPSWVAGGSTMFFQNMHRRPCMTCVFFTACQLYSLFFWNHSANSYGPQKLVMIWARAVFYSVLGVGRLYWRYILLVVLVSKMQGYPLRRHWQPTSVTHLWKPTFLDSTQQKTCRWTYVG